MRYKYLKEQSIGVLIRGGGVDEVVKQQLLFGVFGVKVSGLIRDRFCFDHVYGSPIMKAVCTMCSSEICDVNNMYQDNGTRGVALARFICGLATHVCRIDGGVGYNLSNLSEVTLQNITCFRKSEVEFLSKYTF